jgi:hypothetical protein
MKRAILLFVLMMCMVTATGAQQGISTMRAGDYFRQEAARPADLYNDPPALLEAGWEDARCATIPYRDSLQTDLYWPAASSDSLLPIIVQVFSYDTAAFLKNYGKVYRLVPSSIQWMAELANRGFLVVCPDVDYPGMDLEKLLAWLRTNGPGLGGDPGRMGFLSFSANATSIPYLLEKPESAALKAIVMFYPELVLPGFTPVKEAAIQIIKAGRDNPTRNNKIETLAKRLREAGNPVEVLTYENGIHAFDLKDRSPEAASFMKSSLDFFAAHMK